jgi:hypothetical protein
MWPKEFFRMNVSSQRARNVLGWILGIAAFSPLALCYESQDPRVKLSDVTGQVSYSGRPLTGGTICLESEVGNHSAFGKLGSDGSFRLQSGKGDVGAFPGMYHAYLYSRKVDTSLPARFRDSRTAGLEIKIASGWSDLKINLH